MYYTEILKYSNNQRGKLITEIVSVVLVMRHNSAKLQRAKQTLTTSKNLLIIEFTKGKFI